MAGSALYAGALAGVEPVGASHERSLRAPDGRARTYRLYVPSSLPAGPAPLLVALHGGYGSGARFEVATGFSGLAEANGFLYNMVRAIAGSLVQVGRGFWPETQIADVLKAMVRTDTGFVYLARGMPATTTAKLKKRKLPVALVVLLPNS